MGIKGMELKPCPFCGGEAEEYSTTGSLLSHMTYWTIRCKTCGGHGEITTHPKSATEAWNRRYEPPNEPLTLEELREMVNEPIWIVFDGSDHPKGASHWYLFHGYLSGTYVVTGFIDTWKLKRSAYGKTWLAFRRRPEEEK
ncbi:restriction alleviation protein, Lar family [bacterium D16-76]|nr:restriction alleviation protein, Lar family [bacterium D16-76]